jgi:uncharacterized membrane protein YebE (DUF533 family)
MDAIDILGSLLGHKSSRPGKGTDVLTDILGGGSKKASPTPSQSDVSRQAKELEELLNVANGRQSHTHSAPKPPQSRTSSNPDADWRRKHSAPGQTGTSANTDNDRATVLVRAMVNAAKSDGQIDSTEQQRIIDQLHNPSPDAIQFLREEFRKPLNVREFAMSVPIGMEQQVYTLSLIAIDLDTGKEAKYLMELAESLRLPTEVREQIHQRLGAPSVY